MPWKISELATDVAHKAVSSLEGAGIFAVELFWTNNGQVIVLYLSSFLLDTFISLSAMLAS